MIYLAEKGSFTVDLGKLASRKKVKASWIDPVTGNSTSAGSFKARGEKSFVTPDSMEDSILIIEAGS
jgi:hypothetical protein